MPPIGKGRVQDYTKALPWWMWSASWGSKELPQIRRIRNRLVELREKMSLSTNVKSIIPTVSPDQGSIYVKVLLKFGGQTDRLGLIALN